MTETKEYTCKTCDAPGRYVRPEPGDYRSLGTFVHSGDDQYAGHDFDPRPQCPKCDSFNYEHYQTNWGNGSRCHDCGYDFYVSLGD